MSTRRLAAMVLVVAVATAGTLVTGQAPAPARNAATSTQTTTSGVSAERLARLDAMLQSYVDQGRLPGVVALVLRDGRPVIRRRLDGRTKRRNARCGWTRCFALHRNPRAITSVAALTLVEDGKLSLSDQVGAYIPSFAKTMVAMREGSEMKLVPAKRPITIRDLLDAYGRHLYGIEAHMANDYAAKGLGPPPAQAGTSRTRRRRLRCDRASGHAAVRGAARRGVGLRLQHRRAGLRD